MCFVEGKPVFSHDFVPCKCPTSSCVTSVIFEWELKALEGFKGDLFLVKADLGGLSNAR